MMQLPSFGLPPRWLVVAGLILAILGATYGAGVHHEHTRAVEAARRDSLARNTEQLAANARVLAAERQTRLAEAARDSVLRARYAIARAAVRIEDPRHVTVATVDTTGAVIDSTFTVPPAVVTLLETAEATIRQDSVTILAQAAEIATLETRDTLHVAREGLLNEQPKPDRCGRRCGFVAGVGAVLAVTHPAEIAKAALWLVRRVH